MLKCPKCGYERITVTGPHSGGLVFLEVPADRNSQRESATFVLVGRNETEELVDSLQKLLKMECW